ncbi:hypothetical protein MKX08_003359 [Trichoderma sp. CBMAI-0020]|nr:hypothetical protein MKX08_003359 [Trichoderma sp. CBMAI-0020]
MSGAEILGVAAAAEQFVEVASKTAKFIKAVFDQIQDAPDQISRETGRIETLTSLAKQIKTTKSLQTEDIKRILIRCEGYMQELQEVLEKISFEPNDALRKKTWKAISGLQEEKDIMKLFTVLHQEYSTLDTHINLRTNAVAEAVLARLTGLDTQGQPADPSKKCLQDLFITDPAIDRAKLLTSKGDILSGTCDWITQKEEFVNWITSDGGLLWISGGPGLGKTMLSIYLTKYLSSYFRPLVEDQCHYATYFFCDAKDNTRNSSVAIVRGLLFQLLRQKEDLIKHILPTYEVQDKQIFEKSSFETIWNIFLRMVNDIKDLPVSCVLDGLDECEPESLQDLLNKLNKIADTSPGLKIIVLSREHPTYLGASLGQSLRIRLDPDAKTEVGDGLDLYIAARVAELSESKHYPVELTAHIQKMLRDKSTGTYLWVSFVVKDLQEVEVSEVEQSLNQLPHGLYPLYERILEQIDLAHRDLTLDILRWCAFAVRPLTLAELASVLKIKPTDLLDRESVLRGKLTYCGHFLSISNNVISLVHQSALDFLTREIPDCEEVPWFSLSSIELEQSNVASACIAYFHAAYLEDEDIFYNIICKNAKRLQYPFFEYATHQWHNHFNHSNQHGIKTMNEFPQFFSNSPIWNEWTCRVLENCYNHDHMYVAAQAGLVVLMQRILTDKRHWLYWKYLLAWRAKEEALGLASWSGHLPIVKLLIKDEVYVDCKSNHGGTPLNSAVQSGHREVAEFLLTCGANVNGRRPGFTPLMYAIVPENLEMVKLLLEWKPQSSTRPRNKWLSARMGIAPDYTLQVNRRAVDGNTPLHRAVGESSMEIVDLLLEHPDIDANLVNQWGLSPMHLALIYGRSDVVQCLVRTCNVPLPRLDKRWRWAAIHFAASGRKLWGGDKTDLLSFMIDGLKMDPQLRTANGLRRSNSFTYRCAKLTG